MPDIAIQLNKRIDQASVADATTISILNNYTAALEDSQMIRYDDMTTEEQEALLVIIDKMTFLIESDVFIFKIVKDGGTGFTLESSYKRTGIDTSSVTELDAGTPLIMRFEKPTFGSSPIVYDVSLWYDDDFLTTELDELETQMGVTVTGNGKSFELTITEEVKLSFVKPTASSEVYVILFNPMILS